MSNNQLYKFNNNELLILLYHGVYENSLKGIENYSGKHIKKDIFVTHLKILKDLNFTFLSIDQIVEYIKTKKKFPKNSVSITFDDGFYNNYKVACPILDDLKIPAVFYITSGLINTDNLFWVDKIEACINNTSEKSINVKLDKLYNFNIENKKNKIQANERIKKFCKRAKVKIRDNIISNLEAITRITPISSMSSNYKILNWDQLNLINNNKLFTIGGHNLYHDTFTNMEPDKIDEEIYETLKLLKNNLNVDIKHYSYPEGQDLDYNDDVIKSLKSQGIQCCPSAIYGFNSIKNDLFNLKRIMPGFMNTPFPIN